MGPPLGKGSLQKFVWRFPCKFSQAHRIYTRFPDAIKRIFANFPLNFRKNPFANDPISELLVLVGETRSIFSEQNSRRSFEKFEQLSLCGLSSGGPQIERGSSRKSFSCKVSRSGGFSTTVPRTDTWWRVYDAQNAGQKVSQTVAKCCKEKMHFMTLHDRNPFSQNAPISEL